MAQWDGYVDERDSSGSLADDIKDEAKEALKDRFKDELSNSNSHASKVDAANRGAKEAAAHVSDGLDAAGAAGASNAKNASDAGKEGAEAGAEAGKEAGKETAKETAKEAGKEVAKEAGKEVAQAAATGGTSLVKTALKIAAKTATRQATEIFQKGTAESDYHLNGVMGIIICAVVLFLTITFAGVAMLKTIPGSTKEHEGINYDLERVENAEVHGVSIPKGQLEEDYNEEKLQTYNVESPLKDGVNDYINGVDEETGLKNALNDAITEECYDIVANLDGKLRAIGLWAKIERFMLGYKKDKSLEHFYAQPWPYDLIIDKDANYPAIGNVMSAEGYSTYSPQYNDVNFLEMLTILCQNDDYDWNSCKYEAFNEYIRTKKAKNLYYELEVKYLIVYEYPVTSSRDEIDSMSGAEYTDTYVEYVEIDDDVEYDTLDEVAAALDASREKEIDGHSCTASGFYIKTKVKPFGLRELYLMAETKPTAKNRDYYNHTNKQLLDRSEKLTHVYLREDVDLAGVYYKDNRTEASTIYKELVEEYGKAKGRSAWYYIEYPFNLQEYDLDSFTIPNDEDLDKEELLKWMKELGIDADIILQILQYFQGDWNGVLDPNNPSKTVATSGCGFTCMAMIASYFTGKTITPNDIAATFQKYYVPGSGMSHSLPEAVANYYGFSLNKSGSFSPEKAIKELANGHPVIISVGPGKYTGTGHIITVVGVTKNGDFIVHDPNRKNYKKYGNVYKAEDLARETKKMWSFSS